MRASSASLIAMHMRPVDAVAVPLAPENIMATKTLESEILRRYVDEVMRTTRTPDASNLARKARMSPSTLLRALDGKHQPRPDTLLKLEAISRVPLPPELAAMIPPGPGAPAAAIADASVPVHALVGSRLRGRFMLNREPYEWTRRLPGIDKRLKINAVRMPDDSMQPWRKPNELVFYDPLLAVADGDHALVEFTAAQSDPNAEETYAIRRFIGRSRDGKTVRLERYWGPPEIEEVPAERVAVLRRILEWSEVVGI